MTPDHKDKLPHSAAIVEGHLQRAMREVSAAQLELGRLGNWTGQLDLAKALKELMKLTQMAMKSAKELQQ